MVITLATVLCVKGSEVRCESLGPDEESGRFRGCVVASENDELLLASKPVFASAEAATAAMARLVTNIREMDISNRLAGLETEMDDSEQTAAEAAS